MQASPSLPDVSTNSRSLSQMFDTSVRNKIINAKTTMFDSGFPLYDELLKFCSLPRTIYVVFWVFLIFQLMAGSLWIAYEFEYLQDARILNFFALIAFFSTFNTDESVIIIKFVVFSLLFLAIFITLLSQIVYYKKNRRFVRWTLYMARFLIEIVPNAIISPLGFYLGQLYSRVIKGTSTLYSVFFVATCVYYLSLMYFRSSTARLFALTPYLSSTLFSSWDGGFMFLLFNGTSIFIPLSFFLVNFSKNMQVIAIVLKLLLGLYLIYQLKFLPFIKISVNSFTAAVVLSCTLLDGYHLLRNYNFNVSFTSFSISLLVVFVVSWIVFSIIYQSRIRNAVTRLSLDSLENSMTEETSTKIVHGSIKGMSLQDDKKRQYFFGLGLDKDFAKCQFYLRVGISNIGDLFVDWSLIKFISEFHSNSDQLCILIQYLSFFPSEIRQLNYLFTATSAKPGLNYEQRFLLYQVYKVMGLRQSSASSEITERLIDLKYVSQQGIASVRKFWESIPNDISSLFEIREITELGVSMFREAILKWPNNNRICEDFSHFLIECATDFSAGLIQKHRAGLIEHGKNFVSDTSFRSFVRCYPHYIKRHILDLHGSFIISSQRKGSSNNSTNHSQISTGTIDGELDIELEEQLARLSFSSHRTRLAFQRALQGKTSKESQRLKFSALWTVLATIAISVFLFVWFFNTFDERSNSLSRQSVLNQFRYEFDAAFLTSLINWMNNASLVPSDLLIELSSMHPSGKVNNININNGFEAETLIHASKAREQIDDFFSKMVSLASSGVDVRTVMKKMTNSEVPLYLCADSVGRLNVTIVDSLQAILSYTLVQLRSLYSSKYIHLWNESKEMCEIISNYQSMYSAFDMVRDSMDDYQNSLRTTFVTTNTKMIIPMCIVFFLLTEPFLFVFMYKSFSRLQVMLSMMSGVDDQTKIEATKPLRRDYSSDEEGERVTISSKIKTTSRTYFYLTIFVPVVLAVVLFLSIFKLTDYYDEDLYKSNLWLRLSISRQSYLIEAFTYSAFALAIDKGIHIGYLNSSEAKDISLNYVSLLLDANNRLMRGNSKSPACTGFNTEFDAINIDDNCLKCNHSFSGSLHSTYQCVSIDRGITLFDAMTRDTLSVISSENIEAGSRFSHLFHLMNVHLIDNMQKSSQIFVDNGISKISSYKESLSLMVISGIAIVLVGFLLFWSLVQRIDVAYQGALQLIRRLPPHFVVSNSSLLDAVLERTSEKNLDKMTTSMSVIHMSRDAVVCLSRAGSIEIVNTAVSVLFGYKPEQLLGQSLLTLLPENTSTELYRHIDLMRNGECGLTFDCSVLGIADDEHKIPCHAVLIGSSENNSSTASSFVVVIRDETVLQKQREDAENAKKQSEHLLYQILPRDIVMRLNQGESDISFSVPSATVIFIDIVKFSDYSSTLTPSQIMENLSIIFSTFDSICAKYSMITKIKLIGDIYMAAAGLFCPNEQPSSHAKQVIHFGLDILVALDDINSQLDSNLSVRIGVNTDGPLIAGVLGTDKPVFDIIGDTINVASRLQSTAIPGTIQISQSTYELISNLAFNIEKRGEIELKGKGKRMAYIVRPLSTGSSVFLVENSFTQQ